MDNHERELAAIVSTYGTTQLGHIELLAENEKVQELRKKGVCLHVDAAYGAYIGNLSRHIQRVIPPADSVTIDSYKFIGKPGLALLVLERDKKPTPTVPYYNQSPFTIHSTLSAGPLAAWQQTINDVNIVKLADSSVELAKRCADDLTRLGVPLIEYPQMSIVPIRLKDQKQVKNIENHLLQEGYKVGLVRIEGKDYTINGIRIVITPKIDPELMYGSSSRLVNLIGEYFSKA